jgi:hypothetical protein
MDLERAPLMVGLFNGRRSKARSGLFLRTTTSPLGKELSVDARDWLASVIAAVGKRSKVQAKTRGMRIARLTDRGAACINIDASDIFLSASASDLFAFMPRPRAGFVTTNPMRGNNSPA